MAPPHEELRGELAALQAQVASLGTGDLSEAVSKLQAQVERVKQSVEAATHTAVDGAVAGASASPGGDEHKGRQKIGAEEMSSEAGAHTRPLLSST
jgi:hypothetical protein